MSCVVISGVAGFLGSTLARQLIEDFQVIGVDNFSPYYDKFLKVENLSSLRGKRNFQFFESGLADLKRTIPERSIDCFFHFAAQPGVRQSWGEGFEQYAIDNVLGTQQALEFCISRKIPQFVYSSSSSIYGAVPLAPTTEETPARPISPYGVSKYAGESLAAAYSAEHGVKVRSLRYFTVFGRGQRPDMAINKLIAALISEKPFYLYGNGNQSRDFTHVDDVVQANLLAYLKPQVHMNEVFNVGGGNSVTMLDLIDTLEEVTKKKLQLIASDRIVGDVPSTMASFVRIRETLGWMPKVKLEDGLRDQFEWQAKFSKEKGV